MLNDLQINEILGHFPKVEFAFAYGSGVVEQKGYDYDKKKDLPMLDFIFVVEDSQEWHQANMTMNPSHYTSLIPLNAKYTSSFQDNLPAHFWFNAYVPVPYANSNGRLMKYGVINKKHAMNDLQAWNNLYLAGRLHKPVRIIAPNETINEAQRLNKAHAVNTSLLLLPEKFTEVDLYLTIAGLSYVGDIRMLFGENPKKVVNLVTPVVPHYQKLYKGTLERNTVLTKLEDNSFVQNMTPAVRWNIASNLPNTMKKLLYIKTREKMMTPKPPSAAAVKSALESIVAGSATIQTMKGLFTVGLFKSSSYLLAKMSKRFLAR